MLDNASDLKDLWSPAGNRLGNLKEVVWDTTASGSTISGGSVLCGCLIAPMMLRLPIPTERGNTMIKNGMRPVHPGEILLEAFMKPAVPLINANLLAKALAVPANRITAIIKGQRGITGDTAVRLAAFFDTTAEFWMNLQKTYELRLAEEAMSSKVRKHIEQSRESRVSV